MITLLIVLLLFKRHIITLKTSKAFMKSLKYLMKKLAISSLNQEVRFLASAMILIY